MPTNSHKVPDHHVPKARSEPDRHEDESEAACPRCWLLTWFQTVPRTLGNDESLGMVGLWLEWVDLCRWRRGSTISTVKIAGE